MLYQVRSQAHKDGTVSVEVRYGVRPHPNAVDITWVHTRFFKGVRDSWGFYQAGYEEFARTFEVGEEEDFSSYSEGVYWNRPNNELILFGTSLEISNSHIQCTTSEEDMDYNPHLDPEMAWNTLFFKELKEV